MVQKSYIFYSLILAVISTQAKWDTLADIGIDCCTGINNDFAEKNLLTISDALDNEEEDGRFGEFIRASSEKTNTKDQRSTRIKWLALAMTQPEW